MEADGEDARSVIKERACIEKLTCSIRSKSFRRMRDVQTHDHGRRTLEPSPAVRI